MSPKSRLFIFVSIICVINGALSARNDCKKRYFTEFESNSFACVCNETYCDTIEPLTKTDKATYQEYVTDIKNYRLEKFINKFQNKPSSDSMLNLTISRSVTYQKIFGFGGAITDSAGFNVYSLSEKTTMNLLNSYFDETGIEYNIIRVPIGGVDFSLRTYTYDDFPNDFNLKNFSLSKEDISWKIPFIKTAQSISKKNLKMFASAWTAPPWMKTDNSYIGNGTLIGPAGGKYYQTWANYYLKFFQSYKQQNIDFWAVTAQNEPTDGYLYKFFFNSMGFTPETQAIFVTKNLGPTLEQNGFDHIKIMILDDQRLFLPGWPQRVFEYSPSEADKYVDGIAVHWYVDSFVPASVLDLTQQMFPNKFIFATEACSGTNPFEPHVVLGGFGRAEAYAKSIIQDLNHWVTGWTDWNLALDTKGGPNWANNLVDSPIIVESIADVFYKQPMFYAMGHFSKFIPENSTRVKVTSIGSNKKVSYVALKYEESRQAVLVLLNENDNDVKFSVYDEDSKQYINSKAQAHSIRTIVWFY